MRRRNETLKMEYSHSKARLGKFATKESTFRFQDRTSVSPPRRGLHSCFKLELVRQAQRSEESTPKRSLSEQTPEKVKTSVESLRETAKSFGRDPSHLVIFLGITVVVDETDEKAQAKYDEFIRYGDREGALALFGGWTGIDLSKFSDDEDFKMSEQPAVRSLVNRWSDTVPGSEGLTWNKKRVADFLLVGGMMPKIVGGVQKVVDELERWAEISGVDGFNLAHVVNPGSFEDIAYFVIPEMRRRGIFRERVDKEGATAREVFFGQSRLLDDHPGSKYKWPAETSNAAFGRGRKPFQALWPRSIVNEGPMGS